MNFCDGVGDFMNCSDCAVDSVNRCVRDPVNRIFVENLMNSVIVSVNRCDGEPGNRCVVVT